MWAAIIVVCAAALAGVGVVTLRRTPHRAAAVLTAASVVPAVLAVAALATSGPLTAVLLAVLAAVALGVAFMVRRAFVDRRLTPTDRALFLSSGWAHVPEYPAHLGDMFTSPGRVVVAARPRNQWADLTAWAQLLPANAAEMQLVAVLEDPTVSTASAGGHTITVVPSSGLGTVTARRTQSRQRRRPSDRRPPTQHKQDARSKSARSKAARSKAARSKAPADDRSASSTSDSSSRRSRPEGSDRP